MSIAAPRVILSPEAERLSARAPKKRLGQHFLTAPHYARRIADAIPAKADDTVVEIGPGTGALSVYLSERFGALHCVEKDADVIPRLRERLGQRSCTIHHADVLTFDLAALGGSLHVVGNLPYNVAALIIRKVLLHGRAVRSFTFMVQREVAERIAAAPGTKKNGYLSVFCQFFGRPRVLMRVPPGAFFPKPKVESAVVQMVGGTQAEERLPEERWGDFFRFVDAGFGQRRKKLVRVLARARPDMRIAAAFEQLNLDTMARAEQLGVEEWVELYRRAA